MLPACHILPQIHPAALAVPVSGLTLCVHLLAGFVFWLPSGCQSAPGEAYSCWQQSFLPDSGCSAARAGGIPPSQHPLPDHRPAILLMTFPQKSARQSPSGVPLKLLPLTAFSPWTYQACGQLLPAYLPDSGIPVPAFRGRKNPALHLHMKALPDSNRPHHSSAELHLTGCRFPDSNSPGQAVPEIYTPVHCPPVLENPVRSSPEMHSHMTALPVQISFDRSPLGMHSHTTALPDSNSPARSSPETHTLRRHFPDSEYPAAAAAVLHMPVRRLPGLENPVQKILHDRLRTPLPAVRAFFQTVPRFLNPEFPVLALAARRIRIPHRPSCPAAATRIPGCGSAARIPHLGTGARPFSVFWIPDSGIRAPLLPAKHFASQALSFPTQPEFLQSSWYASDFPQAHPLFLHIRPRRQMPGLLLHVCQLRCQMPCLVLPVCQPRRQISCLVLPVCRPRRQMPGLPPPRNWNHFQIPGLRFPAFSPACVFWLLSGSVLLEKTDTDFPLPAASRCLPYPARTGLTKPSAGFPSQFLPADLLYYTVRYLCLPPGFPRFRLQSRRIPENHSALLQLRPSVSGGTGGICLPAVSSAAGNAFLIPVPFLHKCHHQTIKSIHRRLPHTFPAGRPCNTGMPARMPILPNIPVPSAPPESESAPETKVPAQLSSYTLRHTSDCHAEQYPQIHRNIPVLHQNALSLWQFLPACR